MSWIEHGVPTPYMRENTVLSTREHERLGQLHPVMRKFARRYAEQEGRYSPKMHAGFRTLQYEGFVPAEPTTPWPTPPDDVGIFGCQTPTFWEHWVETLDAEDRVVQSTEFVWLLPIHGLIAEQLIAFQAFAQAQGWSMSVATFSLHPDLGQSLVFALPTTGKKTARKAKRAGAR